MGAVPSVISSPYPAIEGRLIVDVLLRPGYKAYASHGNGSDEDHSTSITIIFANQPKLVLRLPFRESFTYRIGGTGVENPVETIDLEVGKPRVRTDIEGGRTFTLETPATRPMLSFSIFEQIFGENRGCVRVHRAIVSEIQTDASLLTRVRKYLELTDVHGETYTIRAG